MSAYAAPIEVVQAALHRCGEESITSMDEGSPAAMVATSNYEGIVRAAHARHAWTFATETKDLALEGPVTSGDYVWSWIIPAEVINVRWVQVNGRRLRTRDYVIQGRRILTISPFTGSAPQVVATFRSPEGTWPDDFAEAMVVRLQGLFIESLADKWQDARLKIKDAEGQFQSAIVRDKRQQPPTVPDHNHLGEVWRNRGARSHYIG